MTGDTKRTIALVGVAGLLAGLVVADRAGLFGGAEKAADDAGPDAGARTAYLTRAALAERTRALVDDAPRWKDLVKDVEERWASALSRMIKAPSPEVASARLATSVETLMNDMGLTLSSSSPTAVLTPVKGEGVRVIGLSLVFEAPNPDVVFALLDRLENMPEAMTNIARVSLAGAGPSIGAPTGVRVSLELQALAWIGKDV